MMTFRIASLSDKKKHRCPLYLARGLQWHNPVAEKIYQMELRGYKKRALGAKTYWFDGDKCIEEVQEIE